MNKEKAFEIVKEYLREEEDGALLYLRDVVLALRFIVETYGRPEIPDWLSTDDAQLASMIYADGRKLEAVKYLRSLIPDYVENPLRWSINFLQKYTKIE